MSFRLAFFNCARATSTNPCLWTEVSQTAALEVGVGRQWKQGRDQPCTYELIHASCGLSPPQNSGKFLATCTKIAVIHLSDRSSRVNWKLHQLIQPLTMHVLTVMKRKEKWNKVQWKGILKGLEKGEVLFFSILIPVDSAQYENRLGRGLLVVP